MKRRGCLTAILLFGLTAFSAAWGAEGGESRPGRPRLLVFGSQGCAPCVRLKPLLETLREEFADRAEVAYVDLWREGDGQAAVEAYELRALPTLLFFDGGGALRHRLEGYSGHEDLRALLEDVSCPRP